MTSVLSDRINSRKLRGLIGYLLICFLFAGCRPVASGPLGPGAATPEAAALQTVINSPAVMPNFQVDVASASVRQSIQFMDHFLVMVGFQGVQLGNDAMPGQQRCLFTYQVLRTRLGGWATGSGGGSCTVAVNPNSGPEPMSIGASNYGGNNPADPGYSTVDGEVNQQDIINVIVTWEDNQVQNASVINGTFIAPRQGQHQMKQVDGLNEAGQVVYSSQPHIAPGKQ
jgi:hypothetical protein